MNKKIFKYSRIVEDIFVDVLNNTLIRKGLSVQVKSVDESISLLGQSGKSVISGGMGKA